MTLKQPPRVDTVLALPPLGQTARGGRQLGAGQRRLLIAGGLALLGALTTARCLVPDSKGFGTHQQLGLFPCGFAQVFGIPCPSCGMTTSWAHLTRGNWSAAAQCNLGGLVIGLTAIILAPWALVSGLCGRWFLVRPHPLAVVAAATVTYFAVMAQWFSRF